MIAQIFVHEQAACRQAHFEHALLADMDRNGIPDTLVNRERATAQLMRAKADMLLDTLSRYPKAKGKSVSVLLGSADANDGRPGDAASRQRIEAATATSIDASSYPDVADEKPAADAATSGEPGEAENPTASLPIAANPNGAVPNGVPLPAPKFMDRCETPDTIVRIK